VKGAIMRLWGALLVALLIANPASAQYARANQALGAALQARATSSSNTGTISTLSGQVAAAQTAVAQVQTIANTGVGYVIPTWQTLASLPAPSTGQYSGAIVLDTDTGTHTDPVVGGTVANGGIYRYSASPAGWQRVANSTAAAVAAQVQQATAAAAAAGNASLGTLSRGLPATRNIFDVSRATVGVAVKATDGTTAVNSGYITSDFTDIDTTWTPSANLFGTGSPYGIAYYDAGHTFISGVTAASGTVAAAGGTTLTRPANATNVRFTLQMTAAQAANVVVVNGATLPSSPTEFAYLEGQSARVIGAAATRLPQPLRFDYWQPDDLLAGTVYDFNGVAQSITGYTAMNYSVPASPTAPVVASHDFVPGNQGYGWRFEDRQGNFVASGTMLSATATLTNGGTQMVVTAAPTRGQILIGMPLGGGNAAMPAKTYVVSGPAAGGVGTYVLNQAYTGTTGSYTVNGGGHLANVPIYPPARTAAARTAFVVGNVPYIRLTDKALGVNDTAVGWADVRRIHKWAGKNGAFLGDSIEADPTGANGRVLGIATALRANIYLNNAHSGSRWYEVLDTGPGTGVRALTQASVAAADFLHISAGTNDFEVWSPNTSNFPIQNSSPLGTINDTPGISATGTFYSNVMGVLEQLYAWNPMMRVFVATPLPRFDHGNTGDPVNAYGAKLSDFANALISICALPRYNCQIVDNFRRAGLNAFNQSTYTIATNGASQDTGGLHPGANFYKVWTPQEAVALEGP
jgi:hypothetical protein